MNSTAPAILSLQTLESVLQALASTHVTNHTAALIPSAVTTDSIEQTTSTTDELAAILTAFHGYIST